MSTPHEVLVMVNPSWVGRKRLHSASFRAEKVRQTKKAVCLKLKDGCEIWLPWSAIESMEWADRPSMQSQKPDHHGYLNYPTREANKRTIDTHVSRKTSVLRGESAEPHDSGEADIKQGGKNE